MLCLYISSPSGTIKILLNRSFKKYGILWIILWLLNCTHNFFCSILILYVYSQRFARCRLEFSVTTIYMIELRIRLNQCSMEQQFFNYMKCTLAKCKVTVLYFTLKKASWLVLQTLFAMSSLVTIKSIYYI